MPLYDRNERIWVAPAPPLLFQWKSGGHHRAVSAGLIRNALTELIDAAGVKDAAGEPLYFQPPHDLRRIFATDAIMNGMPPHIAQVLLGAQRHQHNHGIQSHLPGGSDQRSPRFISRRRALRPSEEYRTPDRCRMDEFLGHFERRKLALGECGRAYGTSCQHEHSCIRCPPVLRVDPAQRFRLVEIRDNLTARITEADSEGWIGEAEGLRVSSWQPRKNWTTSIGGPVVPFNSTCPASRTSSRTPFSLTHDGYRLVRRVDKRWQAQGSGGRPLPNCNYAIDY